ncbi:MAG: VOC family protein [Proteobacteria bacterium]|nr:VOC family protein [Pseudomonadota bacterium]
MAQVRFNHMELTLPRGALDEQMRDDITRFYGEVFGWETSRSDAVGQTSFFIRVDDGQFILLAESSKPMSAPGYDHLGLLCDTREEVGELLEKCRKLQERDERVQIQDYGVMPMGGVEVCAFYLKYLLPIQFDVQHIEYGEQNRPAKRWVYTEA